jgi:cytoskeletal protein CcmA (bactofilin family)
MSSTEHTIPSTTHTIPSTTHTIPSTTHTIPDANRLYIGEGVTIKGEISVPDTLIVCGALEGDVTVGNLIVGKTGAIKGRITVGENAEISGKVFEKLDVKSLLILRSTGRVDGHISYGLLQIEQGASVAGGLSSNNYRPEQKPQKVDLYPRPDQRPQKQDTFRSGKQGGSSAEEPVPNPSTPPV